MGTVYEAADAAGATVAVKTLSAQIGDDPALRRRFEAEIEALKALDHPGIVRLLAFGDDAGRPFFAMELVRGRSLEDLLRSGRRFDWRQTVGMAGEIVRALKSAHDRGIIHRDLKPANLLLPDEPGATGSVKLADFGIAKLFGDSSHTQAGTVVGTAEYMAPEQATGGPVDARVDLYALGLVMFAMLAGRPPFRGGSLSEVLQRQRTETPPRISAIVPEVPAALDDLIARLLAKKPAERPASALAVGRLLAGIETASVAPATAHGIGPTVSDTPAAAGGDVDLLAATRVTGNGPAGRLTIPAESPTRDADADAATRVRSAVTAPEDGSVAHRPTAPNSESAALGRPFGGSRFTTVEELHRAFRQEADRAARRDRLVGLVLAGGLLAAVLAVGYAVLKPATADQLHERIAAVAADPAADRRDARPLIELFLARYPTDPRATAVAALGREVELDALERRARRRPRENAALEPLERDYRAAMDREAESPLACLAALEAILALHDDATDARPPEALAPGVAGADETLWLDLVRRQIRRVGPLAARAREEDAARAAATLAEAAELAAVAAARDPQEQTELLARRRALLEGVVEIYASRPHVAEAVAEARRLLDDASRPAQESAP